MKFWKEQIAHLEQLRPIAGNCIRITEKGRGLADRRGGTGLERRTRETADGGGRATGSGAKHPHCSGLIAKRDSGGVRIMLKLRDG